MRSVPPRHLIPKLPQPHHPIPSLLILGLRLDNNLLRQTHSLLIPQSPLNEPVPQVLLVETRLWLALLVRRGRPVAGRVGSEELVDEDKLFTVGSGEEAEFEFSVGEDETAGEGVLCCVG